MPRPKKPGAPEPKRRSRTGCWPCKARKIKCGEEKPSCLNCQRQNETCDYSIRLNWEGRGRKRSSVFENDTSPAPQLAGHSLVSSTTTAAPTPTYFTTPYHGLVEFSAPVLPSPGTETSAYDTKPQADPAQHCFQSTLQFDGVAAGVRPCECPTLPGTNRPPSLPAPSPASSHASPKMQPAAGNDQGLLYSAAPARHHHKTKSHTPSASIGSRQQSPLASPGSFVGTSHLPTSHSHSAPPCIDQTAWREQTERTSADAADANGGSMPSEPVSKRMKLATLVEGEQQCPVSLLTDVNGDPVEAAISDNEGIIQSLPRMEQKHSRCLSHRMSVNSLLSQSLSTGSGAISSPDHSSPYCISEAEIQREEYTNYGYDHGHADLDLYNGAVDLSTMMLAPASQDGGSSVPIKTISDFEANDQSAYEQRASSPDSDGESHIRPVTVFSKGGYYSSPVPVNIPRFLMPLPSSLTQSPINLLYFHHFLNHTGKILAPHACNHNPFTRVLPKMAITNQNLLNLLLAYSASHRARLIGHPEPAHRIAHWVRYVFPSLRHALADPNQRSSPSTLATAIMLVSLKIISPSTFEVPISWQDHLKLARELYVFYRKAHVGRPPTQVSSFLSSWFGYIDILGSISCEEIAPPVPGVYYPPTMTMAPLHDDEDWEIECYSGFTPRTGATMFRLAELISQCRHEKTKEAVSYEEFVPSPHVLAQADHLLQDMTYDRLNVHKRHTSHDHEDMEASASVPRAIDDAYQLACIIQLYRRVLGKSQLDPLVCKAIDELLSTLDMVERGGSAEVCLLFPIFTVGCETTDLMHRQTIIDRIKSFEHLGLKQVREARKLMQRAWEGNCSWTLLTNGEFLG